MDEVMVAVRPADRLLWLHGASELRFRATEGLVTQSSISGRLET